MNRFLFNPATADGEIVFLSERESRHISRALRLKSGAEIELFDGNGNVFTAEIVETGHRVGARLGQRVDRGESRGKPVWLAQGLLKGKKMDTVVQKCTELGASRFSPFVSSRCQGKLDKKLSIKRHERWQRITVAACKQSKSIHPPVIDQPESFANLLDFYQGGDKALRLLFWEEEKTQRLHDLMPFDEFESIYIILGPEGGLTGEEVEMARAKGWQTVSMGRRILRAETASLAALSIVQFLSGNM